MLLFLEVGEKHLTHLFDKCLDRSLSRFHVDENLKLSLIRSTLTCICGVLTNINGDKFDLYIDLLQ